jgi:uncharacterized protein (TIGR02646 family)
LKGTTKEPSPQALIDWWAANGGDPPPVWAALQNPEKAAILLALIEEQKFVCVYCGAAISTAWRSAHIEHFWPSSRFPALRFEWSNLFASCGPPTVKRQPKTCGDAKGNWVPVNHIFPGDHDCERKFAYDGLGQIRPSVLGGKPANVMIDRLKLNHNSLDYQRRQIIDYLEQEIASGAIDASNVAAEILSWRGTDAGGHLRAFGHVAARYLEDEPLS